MLWPAGVFGLACWCMSTIDADRRAGRPVPLAPVAVLSCGAPLIAWVVAVVLGLGYSEAVAGWVVRAAVASLCVAAATVLVALALPDRRLLATAGCVVVVLVPAVAVAVGVLLAVVDDEARATALAQKHDEAAAGSAAGAAVLSPWR